MSSNDAWRSLSKDYETARGRHDSLDRLLEWAAQRDLMGTIGGKDILDVGCGNGEKAIELACGGARSVLGLDIAANFLTPPGGLEVTLAAGDLSDLGSLQSVQGQTFDRVLSFYSPLATPQTKWRRFVRRDRYFATTGCSSSRGRTQFASPSNEPSETTSVSAMPITRPTRTHIDQVGTQTYQ
jgi:SAM-dependent methyltransferase